MSFLSLPAGAAARPMIVGVGPATDLRAVLPSLLFVDFMLAKTAAGTFAWDSASVLPDDGATVIIPNDIVFPAPGRWLLLASPTPPPGSGDMEFTLSGPYSGAIVPGFFDPPVIVDTVGFTVNFVRVARRTAGAFGATRIDVFKNGATIFAGPIPGVAAGAGNYAAVTSAAFAPGANIFAPGDVLEVVLVTTETFLFGPPEGPEGLRVTIGRV